MKYFIIIPGTLPTLNEYVKAERTNRYAAANMKKRTQERIIRYIGKHPVFDDDVTVKFTWIRPNMRCDKDNVSFAKKFILDALQQSGVIRSDSWKRCTPLDIRFAVNPNEPRTEVIIEGRVKWK